MGPQLWREQGRPSRHTHLDDGIVYALGATGELRALAEADGGQIWRTDILEDAGAWNLDWGVAASPLIVDDTVVVLPGDRTGIGGGLRSPHRQTSVVGAE